MTVLWRCLAACAAGAALSLAFAPVAWVWLVPPTVAALFVLVRPGGFRSGAVIGLLFGSGFIASHAFWMRAVSTAAWLSLSAANALYFALLGAVSVWAWRRRASVVWLALAWTAVEGLRASWPFGGMPWGQLSFAVVGTPLSRMLPYVGAVGTTAVLALGGALLADLVVRRRLPAAIGLVALAVGVGVTVAFPWEATPTGHARIVIVQPGLDDTVIGPHHQEVTRRLANATTEIAREVAAGEAVQPDLVVWPENSTTEDPLSDEQDHSLISQAVEAIGAPVLVGAMVGDGSRHVRNQGIVWEPDGTTSERYTKRHPVPWGEYLPMRSVLGWLHFGSVLPGRDMVRGGRPTPLRVGGMLVADAICFDIAHDDVLLDQVGDGAQLVTVQTSNIAFWGTSQLRQQFDITRVRAAETGRAVVVSALNGISGVISPDGDVVRELDGPGPGTIEVDVPLITTRTPAVIAGAWTWRVIALLVVWGSALPAMRAIVRRSGSGPRTVEGDHTS
jgi:apolipoprotein N-acyltransferase